MSGTGLTSLHSLPSLPHFRRPGLGWGRGKQNQKKKKIRLPVVAGSSREVFNGPRRVGFGGGKWAQCPLKGLTGTGGWGW